MSTTFTELKDKIARDLGDPNATTFNTAILGDLINATLAEVGRIAPARFQEDITPLADTLSYALRSEEFGGDEVPELELVRVEVWDTSGTGADRAIMLLQPQSAEPIRYSQAGWVLWGGVLELPNRVVDFLDPTKHLIRVWGYSPYPALVDDDDVVPFGEELEQFLRLGARVEAVRRLIGSRALFKQWQTRSGNADTSMAALMNDLNILSAEFTKKSRAVFVLREAP